MAARFWLGTLYDWIVPENLPAGCVWLRGQQERCPTTDRLHYQLIAGFSKPQRLSAVKRIVSAGHWESTRSEAADAYVWKEDTRVDGTQFELGRKPLRRNNERDWEKVRTLAKEGKLDEIPADIFVCHYRTLQAIAADYATPTPIVREVHVFWGETGTGKSKRAWEEAGLSAYTKDPRSKWWCGYRGESHVIIDEFRGSIDVAHMLRWLDRYPVRVELKGSSRPLLCTKIWITSNLDPRHWYPDLDEATQNAMLRRLTNIVHFNALY